MAGTPRRALKRVLLGLGLVLVALVVLCAVSFRSRKIALGWIRGHARDIERLTAEPHTGSGFGDALALSHSERTHSDG